MTTTLGELLIMLSQADDGLSSVDFDPATVVGDVKDKVDAIKTVVDRLEFQESWCRQQAKPFQDAALVLANNRKRLLAYVVHAMGTQGFEQLPGRQFQAKLQDNPPALEVMTEATALDAAKYPAYCEQIRFYQWNNGAIKTALKDGAELPFAKLTRGKRVAFSINKPVPQAKKELPNVPSPRP